VYIYTKCFVKLVYMFLQAGSVFSFFSFYFVITLLIFLIEFITDQKVFSLIHKKTIADLMDM